MTRLGMSEQAAVTAAVTKIEEHTSGELVTVLAEHSDGYSDVILVYAAALAFSAMSLFALFPAPFISLHSALTGGWTPEWTTGEIASLTIALGVVTFFLSWALLGWEGLRYRVVPGPLRTMRVHDAAVRHFKVGAERRTHGRTGVLLYLSLRERRAEIVADETIADKVDAEVWGAAMADMLAHIRQGRVAEGLVAGIEDVGKVLAEHFPRSDEDRNELPDRLIVL